MRTTSSTTVAAVVMLALAGGCSAAHHVATSQTGSRTSVEGPDTATTGPTSVMPATNTAEASPSLQAFLSTPDGQLLQSFRSATAGLWALQNTDRSTWVATCRAIGANLNRDIDPSALANAAAAAPDSNLSGLMLDDRNLASQALIACNKGDLDATATAISKGVLVEQEVTKILGSAS